MSDAADWKPRFNPWIIAVAVMSGTFMEVLDTSVANVALPHIAGNMSATAEEATWVITSYLVANAIVLPLTGWISATFGRKNFLLVCIVIFTIASGLSGAATSLSQLVFFRILQGIGGGAMQPVAQSILLESFPPNKRGQAMALYGVGVVVAPILGPILGGWFTDNYSWRWAFYINIPVGFFAVMMTYIFIEDPPYLRQQKLGPADRWGFIFLVLWVSSLQIMLDKGQSEDWFESTFIVVLACMFVTFLVCFVGWELKRAQPVVDLSVFRDSTFAVSTILITIVGAVLYGSVTLSPLFLQQLLGYPAFDSGLAMAPRGAGAMLCMMAVGPLLQYVDGRYLVALGFFVLGCSNLWLGHLNLTIGIEHVAWPNALSGIGIGMIFVPLVTIANDRLPLNKLGAASGVFNLMRNLGGGVGIAVATTMLSRGTQSHRNFLSSHMNEWNLAFQEFQTNANAYLEPTVGPNGWLAVASRTLAQQSAMLAYIDAFTFMGILSICCTPLVFFLRRPRGGASAGGMH